MEICNPSNLLIGWLLTSWEYSAWRQRLKDKLASGYPSLQLWLLGLFRSLKPDQYMAWPGPLSTK